MVEKMEIQDRHPHPIHPPIPRDPENQPTGGILPADFKIPSELEAHEPPEARGLERDAVRLMVSYWSTQRIRHACFSELPDFLDPGDTLVINTSRTINAAVMARRADGSPVEVHFSTGLPSPSGYWIVELRRLVDGSTEPLFSAKPGESLQLAGNARLTLVTPYRKAGPSNPAPHVRLWHAKLQASIPVDHYLDRYGFPIRYQHVFQEWPLSYYQTVYATEPGSAEMPSAGRAFSLPILERLEAKGVRVVPLILHTGVASAEAHELPPEEYYRVPSETAQAVNQAHQNGQQVITVGTTVVRALETVTAPDGVTGPGEGWTDVLVTPQRGIHAVDGLLTGYHEPRSTHLLMLQALASREHIQRTYAEALRRRYLWHEFGDLHLILRR
jgi:S-adenosylmethionine:tRNA ribosyltransferase-isomerase